MTCNPTSAGRHGYIIVAVDYFTKWAEAMPTLNNSDETAALFFFNHVVSSSTPYYPQANGQVEAINKVLKRMLQRMIGVHKRSWHLILYSTLWEYRTSVRNATGFTPFQLVYGLEAILLVQSEISSLKLAIDLLPGTSEEEARFLELIQPDETHHDAALAN
eukprot:PITA_23552